MLNTLHLRGAGLFSLSLASQFVAKVAFYGGWGLGFYAGFARPLDLDRSTSLPTAFDISGDLPATDPKGEKKKRPLCGLAAA